MLYFFLFCTIYTALLHVVESGVKYLKMALLVVYHLKQ